jgi:hypothetical protein
MHRAKLIRNVSPTQNQYFLGFMNSKRCPLKEFSEIQIL